MNKSTGGAEMAQKKTEAWEILRQTVSQEVDDTELDAIGVPQEARQAFVAAMGDYILSDVRGLWYPPSDNAGHSPDALAVTIGQRLDNLYSLYNGSPPQSPIEHRMAGALLWIDADWGGMPQADILGCGPAEYLKQFGPQEGISFYITPQAQIGKYRADFLLWFVSGKHSAGLVIECDGHAFHERTKEQASRDKRRDREIFAAGYPVLRFTGSEIYADPVDCARQVRESLAEPLDRVSRAGGLYG